MLTLFRMVAVIPIVVWLLTGRYGWAFYLAVLAGISDLLDGYLARRFGWMTHSGVVLDPLTDKFLLVSTTLTLGWMQQLPWWLVGLVVARDLVIVLGGLYYHYRIAKITDSKPTMLSKWNTFFQILLVVCVMFSLAYPAFSGPSLPWLPWLPWLVWAVAITTTLSGIQYVAIWSARARRHVREA